ncbi:MAG: O-antigen ligase family protein [Blastocatellia bacterium]
MRSHSTDHESAAGRLISKIISGGLLALIVFTSLAHGTVEPWSISGFTMAIAGFLILWMIKSILDRKLSVSFPPAFFPLAALFLVGCIQSFAVRDDAGNIVSISYDVEATRMSVEVIGYLAIAMLLAANFLTSRDRLAWFRDFIVVYGLAMAVFGLVQHFTWNGKFFWLIQPTGPTPFPFGPYVNHNHFAGFIEMIAPIPLALILVRAVRGELWMLYGFAGLLMILANVMSLSRGGMISLVAGVMIVILLSLPSGARHRSEYFSSHKWRVPLLASRFGAVAALVVSVGFGLWWVGADPVIRRMEKGELSLKERGADPRNETFFQSRGWIWRDSASMIRANWATGVGLGAFQTAYPIYSRNDGTIFVSQAHNDYLQIAADAGLPGAVLALWFLFVMIRDTSRAVRHRDPAIAGMAIGCAGGAGALLVHSLFDFNLQLPANALLFLVLTAIVSTLADAAKEGSLSPPIAERTPRVRLAA